MFWVVIWFSVECLVFPQSPLTAGHCLFAGRRASSPDCTVTPTGNISRHTTAATIDHRLMPLMYNAPVGGRGLYELCLRRYERPRAPRQMIRTSSSRRTAETAYQIEGM